MPPNVNNPTNNLGKSLYRRILKELRATRNFDHHLRDIRFLLWVPGTKGKRQYDELKRLAVMSSSLHATRKPQQQQQSLLLQQSSSSTSSSPGESNSLQQNSGVVVEEQKSVMKKKPINLSPSIADQIRAVARGLFRKEREKMQQSSSSSSSNTLSPTTTSSTSPTSSSPQKIPTPAEIAVAKAKAIQDGTKRAFWAIKRLQDIRAGLVPNASMWLVIQGPGGGVGGLSNSAYQNYLNPPASPAAANARAKLLLLAAVTGNSSKNDDLQQQQQQQVSSNNKPLITSFDPFVIPKDAQLRTGNFPFLLEFLGIDQDSSSSPNKNTNSRKKKQQQQISSSSSSSSSPTDPVEEYLEKLGTHGKSKNKVLQLELVSRCAAKDGASARYHLSFRLENISEFAVDVKLAHLFAINCESPPVLNEMVCLLPLLGNSILSPYSVSAFESDNDGNNESNNNNTENGDGEQQQQAHQIGFDEKNELNTENLKSVPRKRSGGKKRAEKIEEEGVNDSASTTSAAALPVEREVISDAPHHQFSRKIRINSDSSLASNSGATTAMHNNTTTASLPYVNSSKSTAPDFTAKAKTPDHCAVYDVSVPFQGECVLRGFVLYRTISNSFPPASSSSSSSSSSSTNELPSTVKSRLKVLHLPLIKLVPSASD